MANSKYFKEFKTEVLLAYEKRECSIKEFCSKFQITDYSLKEWIKQFEKYGSEGLNKQPHGKLIVWVTEKIIKKQLVLIMFLTNKFINGLRSMKMAEMRR